MSNPKILFKYMSHSSST